MARREGWSSARIAAELRRRMQSGALKPRERLSSQKDLAAEFGVCQATIQRSLKELERDGLIWTRPGLGRFVAEDARQEPTRMLGIVLYELEHLGHPVITQRLDGIKDVAVEAGYSLTVYALNGNASPPDNRTLLEGRGLDGAIIIAQEAPPGMARELGADTPVVWMDRPSDLGETVTVSLDYLGGGFKAASHVLNLGHARIALLAPVDRYHVGREQYEGVRLAVQSTGLDLDAALAAVAVGDFTEDEGRRSALQVLRGDSPPTALICGSDEIAAGALAAVAELGLDVPGDVSLVAWNDTLGADATPVPLTTVKMDFTEAGRRAARALVAMVQSPNEKPGSERVDAELVARASTATPRRRRKRRRPAGATTRPKNENPVGPKGSGGTA